MAGSLGTWGLGGTGEVQVKWELVKEVAEASQAVARLTQVQDSPPQVSANPVPEW